MDPFAGKAAIVTGGASGRLLCWFPFFAIPLGRKTMRDFRSIRTDDQETR